jgi:hypothetical protein
MANNVDTYVSFERISEEGAARFLELCERFEGFNDEDTYEYTFSDIIDAPQGEDESDYSYNIDKVGAKWAYVEDPSELGFACRSAWCVPTEGIKYIFDEISKVDPKFIGTYTYYDEMPNFVGWQTYTEGDWGDYDEWDWEHIQEGLLENNENLRAEYNEEDDEFTSEGLDILQDLQYEYVEELVGQGLRYELELIYEAEREAEEDAATSL